MNGAFFDELCKIAVRLNDAERRRQAIEFAGLGALSGPVIGGVSNLIQHGKLRPATQVPLTRWVPAQMAAGALISGAIPLVRRQLERGIQEQALSRQRRSG